METLNGQKHYTGVFRSIWHGRGPFVIGLKTVISIDLGDLVVALALDLDLDLDPDTTIQSKYSLRNPIF
jgi:hypothetical protein